MKNLRLFIALLSFLAHAAAAPIPEDAFPGIDLDAPLEDLYATGEALALKGNVADEAKADGQILFRFSPRDGGDPLRTSAHLRGTRFEVFHIFLPDQAGVYDIEVFLGGRDEESLAFVGRFEALDVVSGNGTIFLPQDFFSDVIFDAPLATAYETGEEIVLSGRISDPDKSGGQILFNFIPALGAEATVFLSVEGDRFEGRHLFEHDESGDYVLEVYLGGSRDEQLGFVGRFPVFINQGSGAILLPVDFFAGVELARPMPVIFPVGQAYSFAGRADEGIISLRLDLENRTLGTTRHISVGLDAGRFARPLRLQEDEVGELELTVVIELRDGQFQSAGSFAIEAIEPPPAPRLELGALALGLLPDTVDSITLFNSGEADDVLRYAVSGPFEVVEAPEVLAAGGSGQVALRYGGTGGGDGLLQIASDDPQEPVQTVALRGLQAMGKPSSLRLFRLGEEAEVQLDFEQGDYVLVLYSSQVAPDRVDEVYNYSLGAPLVRAKVAALEALPISRRDLIEAELRHTEKELAAHLGGRRPSVGKRAAADYAVGDRRTFVFPEIGAATEQIVSATVVAISAHSVAWIQDDLRLSDANIGVEQIQSVVQEFSRTNFDLTVDFFGAPSDVDGDGKVSFLFTHLVDDAEGIAGFYNSSSVLGVEDGGNGNLTDMIFLSPTQSLDAYRPILVHEFQHLINFNQHVLVRGGDAEESWLNEGLSHLSEDMVAGHATSGNGANISAFLRAPQRAGLGGDAALDDGKRGAAYLFVRSLVDRMGEGILLRLVGTGLADRDNVEAATGETFEQVIAFWSTQLYASGLGVLEHARFNYASPLLQGPGGTRGMPLPTTARYQVGGAGLEGQIAARGASFVEVRGAGLRQIDLSADVQGAIHVVAIPLPKRFVPRVEVPADYIPGFRFEKALPGVFEVERDYAVEIAALSDTVEGLLLRFAARDTLEFWLDLVDGKFTSSIHFNTAQAGVYDLEVLAGSGDGFVHFVGGFAPVEVRLAADEITAVAEVVVETPGPFVLEPNYPNPFNAQTVLRFQLPEAAKVRLEIFDVLGQSVRLLIDQRLASGYYRTVWDGSNERGVNVGSGIYFTHLDLGGRSLTRKMLVVR